MNTLGFLQNLGLSDTEITLYELLLKLGETPASEIIQASGIRRPTVYKALYSLEKKGYITQREVKKKIHFRPQSPSLLLAQAESRFTEARQVRNTLQAVMPTLLSSYTRSVERPVVQVFEGVEGMIRVHKEVLNEQKEILAYVLIAAVNDAPLDDF